MNPGNAEGLRTRRGAGLGDLLLFAVGFGSLTAIGELVVLTIKSSVLGRQIDQGPASVWMIPLAELAFFIAVSVLLLGVARLIRRPVSRRLAAFVPCFLCFFSILLGYRGVDMYARALLAAGGATVFSAVVVRYAARSRTTLRHASAALLVMVALLAVAVTLHRHAKRPGPTAAAPAGAPSVLFIILDTVAGRDVSLYGYHRATTPNLEALAQRGVTLTRAFSTAPWTVPSHASMFTGRYPHEQTADWRSALDSTHATVAETFRDRGYRTGSFAANRYLGFDFGLDRGFEHVAVYPVSVGEAIRSTSIGAWLNGRGNWVRRLLRYYRPLGRKGAPDISRDFLQWRSRLEGQPYFAFLNYLDVHAPYVPPPPYDRRFAGDAPRRNPMLGWEWKGSASDIALERALYDGAIAYLDDQIGSLIAELERQHALDNTIVVISSDHGEQFGEHGHMEHSGSLYLASLHVPLLIWAPQGVPAGRRIDEPVTLRDLPATMVELAGVRAPGFGASLTRFWTGSGETGDTVVVAEVSKGIRTPPNFPISKGDMVSLIAGRYQYIVNGDGSEELYDFEADPLEAKNLTAEREFGDILQQFRTTLADIHPAH